MRKLVLKRKRVITVLLVLCIYFSLLTLLSLVRAPEESKAVGENLVMFEDFEVEAEENRAWVDESGLHFHDYENTEKKFSSLISLKELQQIRVEFLVECPEEFAGTAVLHVDLCTDGYDANEQEFTVELKAGQNEVVQVIDKGNNAPDEVQFRIFCLDAVQCDISGLNVQKIVTIPHGGKWICVVALVFFISLLLFVVCIGRGKPEGALKILREKKTEGMKKSHLEKQTRKDFILSLIAAILFALTIVYIFTIWNLGFHSDSASANILAREQMRTGQLFPDTWNNSTGVMIIFYNLLIIPFSLFTNNQILLRDMAVVIFLIAFVLSFCYLSKKFLKSNFYLIVFILFFSGTSATVIEIAFAQAAYLIQLLSYTVLFLLFYCSLSSDLVVKNKTCFSGLLFYIAYLGLHGPLNFAYYLLPLFGAVVLYFVFENFKGEKDIIKREFIKAARVEISMVGASLIGLVGYHYLSRSINFQSGVDIVYPDFSDLMSKFIRYILLAIGYRSNVSLFSVAGIMNAVILFGFCSMVICVVLLCQKYREQSFAVRILINFSAAIFALYLYFDFTVYCTFDESGRYFFVPLFFLIVLASYYLYTYVYSKRVLGKAIVILLLSVFSLPCMISNIPQAAHYSQARSEQLELVNYLKAHDLKHGYATFWNAGNNMVLSDFEVEIGGVLLTTPIKPYYWLSSTTTYDPNTYSGKTFLMLTQSENEAYSNTYGHQMLGTPEEVLSFGGNIIYVYPYNISKNDFEGVGPQSFDYVYSMCVSDPSMKVSDSEIRVESDQIIYGPYTSLDAGNYQIDLGFSELEGDIYLRLTSDAGKNIVQEQTLNEKEQTIYLNTEENLENFEVVLTTNSSAVLCSLVISKIE